jgi:hypothetical protein
MMTEENETFPLPSDPLVSSRTNPRRNYLSENDYPFITEEFGKLQVQEKVLKSFIFNNPIGTYLFTTEEGSKLSIYVIKSYIN